MPTSMVALHVYDMDKMLFTNGYIFYGNVLCIVTFEVNLILNKVVFHSILIFGIF